jgi:hypothetical protein
VIYTESIGEAVLVLLEENVNTCEVELLCLLRCLCVSLETAGALASYLP